MDAFATGAVPIPLKPEMRMSGEPNYNNPVLFPDGGPGPSRPMSGISADFDEVFVERIKDNLNLLEDIGHGALLLNFPYLYEIIFDHLVLRLLEAGVAETVEAATGIVRTRLALGLRLHAS